MNLIGDANCPPEIVRAKRIKRAIESAAAVSTLDDGPDSSKSSVSDASSDEDSQDIANDAVNENEIPQDQGSPILERGRPLRVDNTDSTFIVEGK